MIKAHAKSIYVKAGFHDHYTIASHVSKRLVFESGQWWVTAELPPLESFERKFQFYGDLESSPAGCMKWYVETW